MIVNPITINNAATLSDGGTKYLIGVESNGKEFSILLAQHKFHENFDSNHIPGCLHFNEKPIDVRSNFEKDLIKSLENCLIKTESNELDFSKGLEKIKDSKNLIDANNKGPNYGVAYLIKVITESVQSDEYVEIVKKFNTNM